MQIKQKKIRKIFEWFFFAFLMSLSILDRIWKKVGDFYTRDSQLQGSISGYNSRLKNYIDFADGI